MQLKELYISNFKNLKDIRVNFENNSNFNILIGKNGIGKSNLFEAIIEIFLFLLGDIKTIFQFELKYNFNNEDIDISYKNNKLIFNGKEVKKIEKEKLPETIVLYYSGNNERMMKYSLEYEKNYRGINRKSLSSGNRELRNIFGINNLHKEILLLMVFLLDNDNEVKSQVLSKLELSGNYRKGKLILKKPFYARRKKIDIMNPLDEDMFWGIKGSIRYFLNKLLEGNRGNTVDGNEGYFSEDKKYYITLDKEVLTKLKENYNNFSLFELLDDLRVAEMLDDIEMEIEKINGEYISISSLSEGEIQTVVFNGIIEIFKEKNCIFLLDEPDAFLHPEWQINLIDGLKDTNEKNHIIMSSHNPSTIVNSTDELIMCWKPLDKLLLKNVNKQFAMNTLSSGYYQLDEEEGILSILKKIQNEDKPVIFTEGITDKVILEISWNKLRRTPMPFLIVPMFSCNFLSKVLLDVNIQNQINNKMIGLFDFDEAYNEWNRVMAKDNSILLENNPYKGLTAKLSNKEVYSILLPVPDNELIKKQVIDCETSLTTFKYQSKLSIELLFFEKFGIGEYFELVNSAGGKIVAFKNNSLKRKFSEEIIKDLEVEAFGVFDDLFNTIEEKIL